MRNIQDIIDELNEHPDNLFSVVWTRDKLCEVFKDYIRKREGIKSNRTKHWFDSLTFEDFKDWICEDLSTPLMFLEDGFEDTLDALIFSPPKSYKLKGMYRNEAFELFKKDFIRNKNLNVLLKPKNK